MTPAAVAAAIAFAFALAPWSGVAVAAAAGTFAQVATLVADGRLQMTVGLVLPLAEAAQAQVLSRRGGAPGKFILKVD